jgi:transcriptional regulator with XRE-family HTH domain
VKPEEPSRILNSEGRAIAGRISASEEIRQIFVEEEITVGLPMQIAAMREAKGWSQQQLAEVLGMTQSAVSRIESLDYGRYSLSTLKRIAAAFDVGLVVRFDSFANLIDYSSRIGWNDVAVPSFADDPIVCRSLAVEDEGRLPTFEHSMQDAAVRSNVIDENQGQLGSWITYLSSVQANSSSDRSGKLYMNRNVISEKRANRSRKSSTSESKPAPIVRLERVRVGGSV